MCQVTNIQQGFKLGYHQGMKGKEKKKGFLKNVGVKLNFQGRIGVVGGSGEQGIWRSSESCFSEKQLKKKKKRDCLSLPD